MAIDTRQQILDAAERIIRERGLCNVKARDIAREAGYADGTLYVYFNHKEDIFLSVLHENLPNFVGTVLDTKAGENSVRANLEEIAFSVIRFYERIVSLTASLFADSGLLERYRQILHEQQMGPQKSYELFAAYIQAEQRLGRIAEHVNPLSIATMFLGSCFQYVFFRQFLGESPLAFSEETFVHELALTLSEGLLLRRDADR